MATTKTARLVLFATVREAVGHSELLRPVPPIGQPLEELLAGFRKEYPTVAPLLGSCRYARNGRYITGGRTRIRPGDEIAVHPPFSGG